MKNKIRYRAEQITKIQAENPNAAEPVAALEQEKKLRNDYFDRAIRKLKIEAKLRDAGFYAQWRKTYGDEAWAILEAAVGRSLA